MEKKMTMPMSRCRVCAFWGLAIWLGLSSAAGAQVAQHTGVLNPNIAGETEIAALAGVSPALAARIVANRPFLTMAAFDHLVAASLGERTQREALYARLFVPINLNTASEAEILLVPGVGNRLAHEFEEYRPYRDGAVQTRDRQVRR